MLAGISLKKVDFFGFNPISSIEPCGGRTHGVISSFMVL